MFVWSEAQAKQLLGIHIPDGGDIDEAHEALHNPYGDVGHVPEGTIHEDLYAEGGGKGAWSNNNSRRGAWMGERLLDLGAGDGYVTKVLAKGATHVDVTETSPIMRRRLSGRGYRYVLHIENCTIYVI